ncbi:NADH-quinone oxidoreductase subunit NuoN [Salinisphaera sp.]|uniref:NADH-quinone oxidoreductase subunit NuoN n=1 Tax=Salinisphaera sp. TaxID=1914330 RepID=UPI000C6229F6|nr:NADH-quinone oxidoreductase subunit NuoN [Salinisphaera sp.]MBS61861.1 NADH-quinone oxidoreductase subunit NuoN [Salinisphaera sp.]
MTDFSTQMLALAPLLILCATVVGVMLSIAVHRHHFTAATMTVVGLNAALLSLLGVLQVTPIQVTPLFIIDDYSLLFGAIVLVASLACTTLAHAYLDTLPDRREEFYILLLCSAGGALALIASRHFASLFIGLELLSVPLYGMVAYAYRDRISLEAGLKYMVLSGAASAFLLFGMALLYAASGSLEYAGLVDTLAGDAASPWLLVGVGMMVVALAFKLSLVPFHIWTPDVYEGAPGPVSAFLATVSKVAVFALLLRFFTLAPPAANGWLLTLMGVIAMASMLVGNLLALRQRNVKRLLGYSSIAHLGYLMTAIVAGGSFGIETVGIYLATYVATTLGAFGVVTLVSSPYSGTDAGALHHYRGLFWRRPYLATVFTIMMLSLAGIPMTAGFLGKFYVIAIAVQSGLWWLVGGIVLGSAIGLYYYLRMMVILFLDEPGESRRDAVSGWGQQSGGIMVLLLALAVIFFGIYPQPLISLVCAAGMAGG